jgi:hypothetical protein
MWYYLLQANSNRKEKRVVVKIVGVHFDANMVPYYSIRFPDGSEKQTTPARLELPLPGSIEAATEQ